LKKNTEDELLPPLLLLLEFIFKFVMLNGATEYFLLNDEEFWLWFLVFISGLFE